MSLMTLPCRVACAMASSRAMPSPRKPPESTRIRSHSAASSSNTGLPNGASSGHHRTAGRSWMMSGATVLDRCWASSPPTRSTISSVQTSELPRSGIWQAALICASNVAGPSGSLGVRMTARDGCLAASAVTAPMARARTSSTDATTMRVSTEVRVRIRTLAASGMCGARRGSPRRRAVVDSPASVAPDCDDGPAWATAPQIRDSSWTVSAMDPVRIRQRVSPPGPLMPSMGSVAGFIDDASAGHPVR